MFLEDVKSPGYRCRYTTFTETYNGMKTIEPEQVVRLTERLDYPGSLSENPSSGCLPKEPYIFRIRYE